MAIKNNDGSLMSDINVTPFVDVMLVLLIIFMVTAPMMVQGVGISLPQTKEAEQLDTEEEPLIVTINKDGDVMINDFKVGAESLEEKLIKIFENRTSREVFLKADKMVPYGVVVQVMSEIKGSGVEKLGVVTEPAGESAPEKK